MTFSITILGSGSALPTSKIHPSAHIINAYEHFFLIDCGEGTQIQLRKYKINLSKIEHIFISHIHGDHVFGLLGLLSTYNLLNRQHDLYIYGHKELEELLIFFKKFAGQQISYKINFIPYSENSEIIYEDKNIFIQTFPLKHKIPVMGFLIKEKPRPLNIKKDMIDFYKIPLKDIKKIKEGADFITQSGEIIPNEVLTLPPLMPRSYAYCTDTLFTRSIIKYIEGVDILYHEATYLHKDIEIARETTHSTALQAATIAKEANAKKLIIGHFSPRYKDYQEFLNEAREVFDNTELAEEGKTFNIQVQRIQSIKVNN